MGNSVAAGNVLTMTQLHHAVGFEKTLWMLMSQHRIQPWSAKSLVQGKLNRQQELARISPFRYIPVHDGMNFYSKHAGGWVAQLTREKFVQLSLDLFDSKGLKCPPEEAKVFYDVFDAIDMYDNATLSIGELVGGLVTFFSGTFSERATVVYNVLGSRTTDKLSKPTLSEFLKPYVWSMVPDNAEVLRPILSQYVADEMFADMGSCKSKDHVCCSDFVRWVQLGHPNVAQLKSSHTTVVFSNVIVERVATIVEGVVHAAWQEYHGKEQLRTYGQQTWEVGHGGQTQLLMDVGMYRYAESNLRQTPIQQPAFVTDIASHVSSHMQGAMDSMSSMGSRGWRWSSEVNESLDSENEIELDVSERSGECQHVPSASKTVQPPAPSNDWMVKPLPNLLEVPTAISSAPRPLSSLPATACGLSRPEGFPQYDKALRAPQYHAPARFHLHH